MENAVTFQFPLDKWPTEWEHAPLDRSEWSYRMFSTDDEAEVALIGHVLQLMEDMVAEVQGWGSSTLETFPGGLTAWVDPSNEGGAKPLIIKLKVSSLD